MNKKGALTQRRKGAELRKQIPVFQCTKCKRFFVRDVDADDGEVIPDHPMKVLVEEPPKWMLATRMTEGFVCDMADCMTATIENAVRLLAGDPSTLRKAPPFLVGKLKLALANFNAKTMTWRKS